MKENNGSKQTEQLVNALVEAVVNDVWNECSLIAISRMGENVDKVFHNNSHAMKNYHDLLNALDEIAICDQYETRKGLKKRIKYDIQMIAGFFIYHGLFQGARYAKETNMFDIAVKGTFDVEEAIDNMGVLEDIADNDDMETKEIEDDDYNF